MPLTKETMHTVAALQASTHLDDVRIPVATHRKTGVKEAPHATPMLAAAVVLAVTRGLVEQTNREILPLV